MTSTFVSSCAIRRTKYLPRITSYTPFLKPRVDVEAVAGAGRRQKTAATAALGGKGRVAADADATAGGDADDNANARDVGEDNSDGGIQEDSDGKHGDRDDVVACGPGVDGAAAAGSQTATPRPSPGGKKEKKPPAGVKKKK